MRPSVRCIWLRLNLPPLMASSDSEEFECVWKLDGDEHECGRRAEANAPCSIAWNPLGIVPHQQLCALHANMYMRDVLERKLGKDGVWALQRFIQQNAAEVYDEQRRDEEYSG